MSGGSELGSGGTVKVTIDGQETEVPAGINIVEAGRYAATEIPHYCYHPRLSVAGNCRICLVEVEGVPKLQIGCNTAVRDGMVIHTKNDRVARGRAGVMEFLLVNHPLDCTICDQAGECKLQDYAVDHGDGVARTDFDRHHKPKNVSWGDKVVFDSERCILCTRCVRFLDEVAGTDEVSIDHRGENSTLIVTGDGQLSSPYQMNIIDICPVGALTSRDFRFKSRLWFMRFTDTVCTSCARGCNVTVGTRDEKILRMVPRDNPDVNDSWMCDHGRLHYEFANDESRMSMSSVGGNPAPHQVAAQKAADLLRKAAGENVLCVASPFMTTEELFALKGVCDALGVKDRYFLKPMGEADDMLVHPEKCPNARGAALAGFEEAPVKWPETEYAALLYVEPREGAALPDEVVARCKQTVIFSLQKGEADVRLPLTAWIEKDGTFISAGDRIQKVAKGTTFHPTMLSEGALLYRMHHALDEGFETPVTAAQAFARWADENESTNGLRWKDLGLFGVPMETAEAAAG